MDDKGRRSIALLLTLGIGLLVFPKQRKTVWKVFIDKAEEINGETKKEILSPIKMPPIKEGLTEKIEPVETEAKQGWFKKLLNKFPYKIVKNRK